MSLRRRLTLAAAIAVAVAVVLASSLTYVLVRTQLRGEIDNTLRARVGAASRFAAVPPGTAPRVFPTSRIVQRPGARGADPSLKLAGKSAFLERTPVAGLLKPLPVRPGQDRGFSQIVTKAGQVFRFPNSAVELPVTAAVRAQANSGTGSRLFDTHAGGEHLRVLAAGLSGGGAIETARSLDESDSVLGRIRLILIALAGGGIALAALLGRFVAGTALAPVRRLTDAAEHVAQTQDLGRRIEQDGREDELGRLALSFNSMLDALGVSMRALDDSARAQRQLVADASHELRTPVTSLRMNIELLQQQQTAGDASRQELIADAVAQVEELSALIGDLIELARDDDQVEAFEEIQLDDLVSEAVVRAQRNAPASASFETSLERTVVRGIPPRLDRAISNMLDNAVKCGAADGPIEVGLSGGALSVRDHGPGIAAEDLPHVFDRFYRGAGARAQPGSGLGLAIVRQVAGLHGASVSATGAPGGGTLIRLQLAEL
ncbi:MAG: sensor histidine kinase [Solirubrobacteraceae bacterium]